MRPFINSRGHRRGTVTVIVIAFLLIFFILAMTFAFYSIAEADQATWQKFLPKLAPATPEPAEDVREEQFQQFREEFALAHQQLGQDAAGRARLGGGDGAGGGRGGGDALRLRCAGGEEEAEAED